MELVFRMATYSDLKVLLPLVQAYYAVDHLPFDDQRARKALAGLIDDPTFGSVLLIFVKDELVGYFVFTLGYSIEYGGRDAFIDEIYICESHRRQGIGQQAIAFAEIQCQRLGAHALHLEVARGNSSAQALYRKVGFVDHDRYLMTKRIS